MPLACRHLLPGVASRHLAAAAVFAALALVWSFPLAAGLSTHLPGAGPGDNLGFLWNFWWMREARATGAEFFYTTHLFAPLGVDLTLHTHTALPALAGASALAPLPLVAAQNVTILLSLFLNGCCSYLLAWRMTRHWGAALVAGLIFAGSPYIAAHLHGHFNLTTAWTIPLFALGFVEALRGSLRWGAVSGLILGATAYIDYYYVVFQMALALTVMALETRRWSWALAAPTPRALRLARIVAVLALTDLSVLAAIALSGGFDLRLGPIRLSAHDTFNPLQALWLLGTLWLWLRRGPRLVTARSEPFVGAPAGRALIVMIGVFVTVAAPLAWNGLHLLARGEYVTQRYLWRSAPKGIDLATLVLGNPFHGLWGGWVRRISEPMAIDVFESSAWLGIAPIVLAGWAVRQRWSDPRVRRWAAIGAAFFVWALGPHLMVFGANTGMILPQALLRYVPLVANARVPGRAIVIVYLALALLSAVALAEWPRRSQRPGALVAAVALLVAVDYMPAPFPVVAIDRPRIYATLRDRGEPGALCELPLGYRDGFGARGFLDHRVLYYQTIHARPILGGFVARLSPRVVRAYESDPLISALLHLSEGGDRPALALPERQAAGDRLRALGVAFVMLNRETASPALVAFVENGLPLTPVAEEGERSLYRVAP